MPTRAEIAAAVLRATGDPDTGVVHDITPALIDELDAVFNPKPKIERAVSKGAPETR